MADKPPPKDLSDYIHPNSLEYKLKLGRVPPEPQEGIIWRGMSGGEYKNLLEQGFLESKGEYNIGETQKGLTIFSSRPRTAEMYAHDFAPKDFKAVPGSSAYVVGIRKPSGAVPQTQENPSEFGVRGQIPLKDIIKVYRGNVFRPKSDKSRAVLDWQEVPVSSLSEASAYSGFEKLPAVIDAASQLAQPPADDPRSKGKGRMFRGIGSLMRGRMFPITRAAQAGWETLSPEARAEIEDYLKRPAHELFGMDKPGIEYFKEWLGISPEDLGETIPLPKVQKIDTALEDISVDPVQGTAPEKTVKAYKLFRTDSRFPGELFPLFVESKSPINIGSWVDAALVEQTTAGKIKSKLGPLAFRPGWHGSEFPVATHIGSKSSPLINKPDIRPDNQVWAEVEFPNDVDWQTEAINRASIVKSGPRKGEINLREAHITDQIPTGGFYRYKTNPNMQNDWLISGSMKINRVLNDADVEKINSAAGLSDLPRARFVHKTRPDTEKAAGGFIDKPLYDDQRMIG